ncbi:cadherin-like domain-containing protein [Microvirga sp. BT688]|uniref:peroxidase family protein n=1 Tax=Microvirga sp. TaxID=1873136 RepID=UPI001687AE6E|nr:peroxidase family protein [Microvirga sp.]MBD2748014.1 cadherin-like domain-containing protein [Microvirga sp.]
MVSLVKHDLEFILKQIKIAEAHAAGGDLAALVAGYNGNDGFAQAHLLPYGLRTVDGSYNNLLPGRENWGAADQSFPGIFTPQYLNDADGDRYDFNPAPNGPGADGVLGTADDTGVSWYTNNNYANAGTRSGSQPGAGSGTVIDADPRIISNLIVDQTLNNPAAIATALTHAGLSGQPLMTALSEIVTAKKALDAAIKLADAAEAPIAELQAKVDDATLALADAEAVASGSAAMASADQAAFAAAQEQANIAGGVRDAALSAYTALLTDPVSNDTQTAEIQAALNTFEQEQAKYAGLQEVANGLGDVADASAATASADAASVVGLKSALAEAQAALDEAQTVNGNFTAAEQALNVLLETHGVEMDGNTVYLPNVSPDEGLSSPFNGWMTIFGQFFDHGLDLVAKGGNGTVYVPLSPDDPLYSTAPGAQNYIPLTRVTVNAGADGILGTADDGLGPKNLTTPWVDQNQTYASSASKQVFMREYIKGSDGKPVTTGHLLEGSNGGLATWADIKAQAKNVLGIELTDLNVGNIPLIASDPYGNFIPGKNGYPQLVVGMGPDGKLGTADDVLREGNPAAPVSAQGVVLTGHAFLDDIAHAAAPVVSGGVLMQDDDSALGYSGGMAPKLGPDRQPIRDAEGNIVMERSFDNGRGGQTFYDNELLDRHFIAGDGRANENIALTAVHQVFHSEHNRIVEHTKDVALQSKDRAFINEWLLTDLTDAQFTTLTDGDPAAIAALSGTLNWDGERLFQVGRFTNEMEYQHLVFEEFGRMMQPDIDAFVFEPSADINPSIAAEFAHVVYRFGHSMLRQDIDIIKMVDGKPVVADVKLFDGFLNPVMYDNLGDAEAASGAIIRGMTRQVGSEIDEFVTDVLRNQLLGIPLDLATINLARGRDVGTPPLNAAREKFFAATGDTLLKPYTSWADFALNLKNPASIINFIAAYGTHESLINTPANPKTIEQLRDAATKLVLGGEGAPADRLDFLNATGVYAPDGTGPKDDSLGGLNNVDFWIGGLAEKKMAFGGMLGSTFAFVFQMTMENLQDADRFYYLSRTQGLNLLNELENNTFAELVMRNTDLGHEESTVIPGNVFSGFEMPILEMDPSKQLDADPNSDNPFLPFAELVERRDAAGNLIADTDKTTVASYIRVNSNEHFVIGGTENNDQIVSGGGDDAIWGKGGNDTIEAGYGVDKVFGGEGDDIITNAGTDIGEADFLHGNEGNDVIHGGSGLSLLFGNQGNDFISTGPDGKEAFGGTGNDFILGGSGGDFLLGNEGDDWLEGGQRFDTLAGENSELFFNSTIIGHDVLNGGSGDTDYDGESGDDITFQNEGIQRSNGMAGFDWAIHKGDVIAANSDLGIPIFDTQEAFILRDRFDLVEGLSGWNLNDTLTGRIVSVNTRAEATGTAAIPGPNSPLDSYSNDLLAKNVGLINGLSGLVAHLGAGVPVTKVVNGQAVPVLDENGVQERIIFSTADASDILLGGGGSDRIKGLAGNDIIDGDKWLNVRIAIHANKDGTGPVIGTADGMTGKVYAVADYVNGAPKDGATPLYGGKGLDALMFTAALNPGQLSIVREMVNGNKAGDVDTAVYTDVVANYSFGTNSDGSVFVNHSGFVQVPGNDDVEEGEGVANPVSDGRDTIRGIEKLEFNGSTLNVIEGTNAGETLNGNNEADLIVGKGGNDTLNGLGGNDILIGGAGSDVLNGGLGNDTYIFGLADGSDTINEGVSATSSGSADRIVIQAAGAALTGLNASDNNTGTSNGSLVINFNGQQITVTNHFTGTNSQTGVELINFDNGTYEGYELGADDYAISRADPSGGFFGGREIDLSSSTVNNFIVGEQGVNDEIVGGGGDDLIFGGTGDNDLSGGAGDDLLVGGSGTGDDDRLDGGTGADVMVGGSGGDTYVVDDAGDVVVETTNGGTDEVQTDLAAYTLGANVEDLTYTGVGTFAGTGNALNNVITGGNGVDTLTGGAGNDTYVVTAGDVVVEVANEGTDTVQSSATYALGANFENLTLTGNAAVNGRGNDAANLIFGNSGNNQLFGGGGNDVLNGNDGNDLLDGGTGNDILNGGNENDILIGGAGNDTIDVGGGVNTIVYNAAGFGNDTIDSFDADGGLATNQDKIDLSALGVTAANFATRVMETAVTGPAGRLLIVNDGAGNELGRIRINNVTDTQIDINDFTLAPAAPPEFGAPTEGPNTITGTNTANTINGLGGNDVLFGGGGNDVLNGNEGADTLNGGDGNDTLSGGTGSNTGTYADNFSLQDYTNSTGTVGWTGAWTEGGDEAGGATAGDILVSDGRLRFAVGIDGGETIQRSINLAGATSATLSFNYEGVNLDSGENVVVEAFNGSAWQVLGTLGGNGTGTFTTALSASHTAIQLRAEGSFDTGALGSTLSFLGAENFYIDNLAVNFTMPALNAGVDTINGDAGDDTIIWNANSVGTTDGRDLVNGGTEGTTGDTFVINGNASAEVYRIYTRDAWNALADKGPGSLSAGTEIVITRDGATYASVIAELAEIEEIRINGFDPAGEAGNAGSDTFQIIGDFSATSLRPNTITIDGDEGADIVDISGLTSAHRIVFRSNGGNDTIVGTLRAQDVIELAPGLTAANYTKVVNENGSVTLTSGTHSITYVSDGDPILGEHDDHDNEEPTDNQKPVVIGERFTVQKGEVLQLTAAQLLANDLDLDGGTLSLVDLDEDEHGTAVLNEDGTITFTPKAGFTGEASFTYTVADGQGGSSEGTVTITVEKPAPGTPANPAPVTPSDPDPVPVENVIETGSSFSFAFSQASVSYAGGHIVITGPNGETADVTKAQRLTFTDGTIERTDNNLLVDDLFYYANNKDVWQAGQDAEAHYFAFGEAEGRDANAVFDAAAYLSANPDVKAAGLSALDHYARYGAGEGRDASASFDTQQYLQANPDVAAAGVNPLAHYVTWGQFEGRATFAAVGRDIVGGFDREYYLLANPDVGAAGINPLVHFNTYGWKEGRNPNAVFDTSYYLETNPDVAAAGVNPLEHYFQFGAKEGRDPAAGFDTTAYLEANPDVAAAEVNALDHFLNFGIFEGRIAPEDDIPVLQGVKESDLDSSGFIF